MTDLQEDVFIGNGVIGGKLHYVEGYTGFSGDPEEQEGNYLALHFEDEGADSISVQVIGSDHEPAELDDDGLLVAQIRNIAKGIDVWTVKDGVTYFNRYEFVDLIKEPKE